MTYNMVI